MTDPIPPAEDRPGPLDAPAESSAGSSAEQPAGSPLAPEPTPDSTAGSAPEFVVEAPATEAVVEPPAVEAEAAAPAPGPAGGAASGPEVDPAADPVAREAREVLAASAPAAEAYPADTDASGPRGRHRKDRDVRRVRLSVKVVATLVIAALVGVAVWTGIDARNRRNSNRLDDSALAAGRTAAALFTSYDYRHIDASLNALSADATGTFKTQFAAALQTLSSAITQAKGVSVGTVQYAGLRERDGDTAVVIAAVNAAVTNTSATTPITRRYRLDVTLSRVGGKWLISDIEPVT